MKKFLIFISLFLTVTFATAKTVGQDIARDIGRRFLQVSAEMNIADTEDLQLVTTYNTNDGEVAFYIFNSSNGFVIVSAVDYAIPILGYSDEGCFSKDYVPVQMEEYMQSFVEQIQYGKDLNLTPDDETAHQWELVRTTGRINNERNTNAVAPLLATIWDQNQFYNNMCPVDPNGPGGHVYAGCVATAMGQIMKYWDYPTTGNGSHTYTPSGYPQQSVNFGTTTYDWANMPNSLSSASTSTQINAVAKLLWHCGVSVDMMYSYDGSGAYSSDVPASLQSYFRYSSDLSYISKSNYNNSSWLALIKSSLDNGMPVYYSGNDANGQNGHAFVCDGYNSSNQLHFNWGWSGNGNNYFSLGALNPGSYDFSYGNAAIINIHPIVNPSVTCQITATASPSTGGTVTGSGTYPKYQTCTLTATPAEGYSFIGWKEGNNIVSTENTYSFPVKQSRNLVAAFTLPAVASVSANYYPDANNPESPYVEVSWMGSYIYSEDFESGFPDGWAVIDADGDGNNWFEITNNSTIPGHNGSNGLMTSASYTNVAVTPNNYLVTPQFTANSGSTFSFWACAQDASWPSEHFGVAVSTTSQTNAGSFTTVQEWTMTAKDSGTASIGRDGKTRAMGNWHQYTVDLSNYANQNIYVAIRHFNCTDMFRLNVDDVEYTSSGTPTPPAGTTYDFDNGTMMSWTSIDADGDGNGWVSSANPGVYHNSSVNLSGTGHNASEAYVISGSYANQTQQALTPNNFLVSPTKGAYSQIRFYACSQDDQYPAEHFGVAVSTTNNTSASAFTTIQEWTLTAKGAGTPAYGRGGETRTQGEWYQFIVDLSAYSGQQIWVAIRHFNCTDQFILNVDDVTLATPGKGTTEAPQIQNYKVYRTNCSNNGPYTPSNTTTLSNQQTGSSYVDNTWGSLGLGSYKFGVSYVTTNGTESSIIWSNCLDKGVGYTITVSADPTAGGTVTGGGLYEQNTTYTLTATANTGYNFVNWTKNGTVVSTTASYSFTVVENATYVAHFTPITYSISASANPAEGGSVTGGGTYNHGATCTLTATANAGYAFVNWTKNGTAVSSNATYSFTVTEGGNYVANFNLVSYTITASADPVDGGSVTGGGTFNYGVSCTLTATTNTGYTFVNWTKNGTPVSANASYTFIVTDGGNYVAHFSQEVLYTVVAMANPVEGATVTGGGTFHEGETCTLTVAPNIHYTFLNWSENGQVVSTETTFSFTVNINHEIVANLEFYDSVDEKSTDMLQIYPNPVYDKLLVESDIIIEKYDIYTISGSLVCSGEENSNMIEVEVCNLRPGTYILRIISDNVVQTKRFIKK